MLSKLTFLFVFSLATLPMLAQTHLPILNTNTSTIAIKDGDILRTDYWTLDPSARPDIYIADKTSQAKTVTFYSDIDSLTFDLQPRAQFDFVIVLNGKDSCFTQLQSGITFAENAVIKPQADTIPFVLTDRNNIYVSAIINQKDTVKLMFHTDASFVGVTEAASANLTTLDFAAPEKAGSWGGGGTTRLSRNNTVQIGSFTKENQFIFEGKHSGIGTDGKFGANFFGDKVLEINYDQNQLIVHNTLPKIDTSYQKMPLLFKRSSMFLMGNSKVTAKQIPHHFLIHSGYSGTILYDDQFADTQGLSTQLKTISESELRDSFDNILKTKKSILPQFTIGGTAFKDLPVGFFAGSIKRQKRSVIGGDLLKRFNIILDLQRAYIYLKPNALSTIPYTEIG